MSSTVESGLASRRGIAVTAVASLLATGSAAASLGVRATAVGFVVILTHELGHASVAFLATRRFPAILVIPPVFGLTIPAPELLETQFSTRATFFLAGSWFSTLLALALLPLSFRSDSLFAGVLLLLAVNAVNLLPVPGLDGSRLYLRATPSRRRQLILACFFAAIGFPILLWFNSPTFWIAWALGSIGNATIAFLRPEGGNMALFPSRRELGLWTLVHLATLTAILHGLWISVSDPDFFGRFMRGMGAYH